MANINGHRIYFEDSGGDGPAVIFSHGFLMDHSMFETQVEALKANYRCITWDERAHGMTDCTGPFSYWDSASDAVGILDELGIDSAVFVGMSQGGFLSLRAAMATPDRVRGVVLIDSQAGVEPDEVAEGYQMMHDTWVEHGPIDDLANVIAGLILGDGIDHASWINRWRSRPPAWFTAPYRCLMDRDDITDRLGEIECPVLIFHGDADASIAMELAQAVGEGVKNLIDFVVVPGAPHAANMTHPDLVNEHLEKYLQGLDQ